MFRSSGTSRFRHAAALLTATAFLAMSFTPALADRDWDHHHGRHKGWCKGRGNPHCDRVIVEERPVIIQQRPVYVAPAPVYVAPPPPVVVAPPPPPVYYQRPSGLDLFLHLSD